jgi:amino acid transporter
LPVALITAELATAMPDPSGFLLWSRRAFGPFVSFLDAWIMIVVVIIDQALYPLIFVSYIETLGTPRTYHPIAQPTTHARTHARTLRTSHSPLLCGWRS